MAEKAESSKNSVFNPLSWTTADVECQMPEGYNYKNKKTGKTELGLVFFPQKKKRNMQNWDVITQTLLQACRKSTV